MVLHRNRITAKFGFILGVAVSLLSGCGTTYKDGTVVAGTTGTTAAGTTTGTTPPVTATPAPTASGSTATFTEVNTQILQPLCVSCHGSGASPDLSSYSSFATNTTFVVPGNAAQSLLYQMVQSGSMPQGGTALNSTQLSLIQEWIDEGALNN